MGDVNNLGKVAPRTVRCRDGYERVDVLGGTELPAHLGEAGFTWVEVRVIDLARVPTAIALATNGGGRQVSDASVAAKTAHHSSEA